MATATDLLNVMRSWIGVKAGSAAHHAIVDLYNKTKPLPVGYKVKYTDDWCAVTVSAAAIKAGVPDLYGRECGVERYIQIFKAKGIWEEDGRVRPEAGWIICYNWDDSTQGNDGWADHIGFVESVNAVNITLIEGNYGGQVKRRTIPIGWGYIRGYAKPNYSGKTTTTPSKPTQTAKPSTGTGYSLAVDGSWGPAFTKALQKYFGTTQDGIISGQTKGNWNKGVLTVQAGKGGSQLVKAIQKAVGTTQDGSMGPATIKAMQKKAGTTQDGVVSNPSNLVKKMQQNLNSKGKPW